MAEKRVKGSILMSKVWFVILALVFISSCDDNTPANQQVFIPDVPVNLTINTDLPLHFHLQTPGNYSLLEGGHRGIILVHNFDNRFYALERTCTNNPDLSCSFIQIDSTNILLRCGTYSNQFDTCCTSQFSFDGNVLQGPAIFPLRQYAVSRAGNVLTIRN